ncbi:hypothetical protein [Streptomyces cyaneofuscatus]|uniref:hypothetical protein n=1 Tax=Streptomyces cyaneofuscatus TaxID=66883 RepID=UPI0033B18E43
MNTRVQNRVSAYAVDLKAGAPVVGETDGSTDTAVWAPLADLRDSLLSPAAVDALRLLAPSP